MDAWVWILIAVVAFLIIVGIAYLVARQRYRRRSMQAWFGPEYDRSVKSERSRRKAERELAGRVGRRDKLNIRPLTDPARERYAAQWTELQGRFVDRPMVAVVQADELLTRIMRERGYPVDNFESQSEMISVDHPDVVQNYRTGHAIYAKTTGGDVSTEHLRRAVVAYRALFEDLLANGSNSGEHAPS